MTDARDALDELMAELAAREADLAARGLPAYWKPSGSHRRNKPKRSPVDPACHDWRRDDVVYERVPCAWGWCVHHVCPGCGQIASGFGPVACPCDHSNGWKSRWPDGQAKPHPPVKPVGRHGSKVAKAARKAKDRKAVTARWSG